MSSFPGAKRGKEQHFCGPPGGLELRAAPVEIPQAWKSLSPTPGSTKLDCGYLYPP